MTKEEEYIKKNKLDEIDAFLFKEFGIIGGACSAQKASEYHTARMVAEKLWKQPVSEDLEEAAMMHYKDVLERKVKTGLETPNMTSFKAGANWQKKQDINKACEWLRKTQPQVLLPDTTIDRLRKAMEDNT